jgi:hypothetical protein
MEIQPIPNHATLPDMPSATNDDHDGRYYTKSEFGDGSISPIFGAGSFNGEVIVNADGVTQEGLVLKGIGTAPGGRRGGMITHYVRAGVIGGYTYTNSLSDFVFDFNIQASDADIGKARINLIDGSSHFASINGVTAANFEDIWDGSVSDSHHKHAIIYNTGGTNAVITTGLTSPADVIQISNDADGRVGINRAPTVGALEIEDGSGGDTRVYIIGGSQQDASLHLNQPDMNWQIQNDGDASLGTADWLHIRNDTGGWLAMSFDLVGNVYVCNGSLVHVPSATTNITAAGGITVTNSIMRIQGWNGAPADIDISADPQIAAGVDGQMVILQGMNDSAKVLIEDGNGVELTAAGSFDMGAGTFMCLIYSSGDSAWEEQYRSVT